MDPFTMMMGGTLLAGTFLKGFGVSDQISAQKHMASDQIAMIGTQQELEGKRFQAMNLDYERRSLQNFRQTQQAHAIGLAAAVNQGAQFSSSFEGGQSQATSQGNYNQHGLDNQFQLGFDTFNLNKQYSNEKIQYAKDQGSFATGQGLSSLGGDLIQSAGTFSNLAQTWGKKIG